MSTRSYIGIEEPNGEVTFVYCHSDGYLEYNGLILAKHWQDLESVRALVGHGGISSLGKTLELCSFYCRDWERECEISKAQNREVVRKNCWDRLDEHYMNGVLQPESSVLMIEGVYLYSIRDHAWYYSDGNPGYKQLDEALKQEDV